MAMLAFSHFEEELSSVVVSWKIIDAAGNEVFKGEFAPVDLTWDNGIELGAINKTIPVESAKKFSFEVEVGRFANRWDFWVYPSQLPQIEEEILVVRSLNNIALSALDQGKKVLLSIEKGSVKEGKGCFNPDMFRPALSSGGVRKEFEMMHIHLWQLPLQLFLIRFLTILNRRII
jgi:hypothetical protein